MLNVKETIEENARRHAAINSVYDPLTGKGCSGERVRLKISDAPFRNLYIPKQMTADMMCQDLMTYGSIESLYRHYGIEYNDEERDKFWIEFCEKRIKYDFEFFAVAYTEIEDGVDGNMVPFVMNRGQRKMNEVVDADLMSGRPVRIINPKARQIGLSTYFQIKFLWIQTCIKERWNSVICAHLNDSAKNIRSMYSRAMEVMPPIHGRRFSLRPFENTQNIKLIEARGCRITVGSAEKPESARSQNPKLSHFSEVAFYPNTSKKRTSSLIASIQGTMKLSAWTISVYESSCNGVGDFFEDEYTRAKNGESIYKPVFIAWFYNNRYSIPIIDEYYNFSGKTVSGNIDDFIRSMSDYEINLFNNHEECTLEAINWYRAKSSEMTAPHLMKQEFPSDDIECFQDTGTPAFRSEDVEKMRAECMAPIAIGTLKSKGNVYSAMLDKSERKRIFQNIDFAEDKVAMESLGTSDVKLRSRVQRNKLKVWKFPDRDIRVSHRYLVIFDPQKGLSEAADWGVITVIDRYPMMLGGKPEIVAQWRGRIDKDITIWVAAQIAKYYDNALLVVESNVYDSTKEDNTELIFDAIKRHYTNLYSRAEADTIKNKPAVKYGFNMNRSTKPMVVNFYNTIIRENGYVERDNDALDEARMLEQKDDGSYGAKEGKNDDIIDTRMIGLHICFKMPTPQIIEEQEKVEEREIVGEASF